MGRNAARAAPGLGLRRYLLERVDVVQDRDLPQNHLADDVRRFNAFGENCRIAGGKTCGELGIVALDARNKRRRGATAMPEATICPAEVACTRSLSRPG